MATLPQIESGRVQLANVPGAQLPAINVPQIDMVGSRTQAQQANTLSQLLDRMSQSAFGEAAKSQERAGVQFAAENPPTAEQLELAKSGDMSWLGAPAGSQNVFDMALRKARSLELASHFEAEGRTKLTELLNQVEEGKITSDVVSTKIKTMTDGLAKSLAPVDADASLKFRASMATYGHTVLKASLDAEQKRAKEQRLIKFDADFDAAVRLLEPAVSQGFWIDPNGQKQSVDVLVDQYRNSIATGAMLLGDANVQKAYSEKFEAALTQVKINALTKYFTSEENIVNVREQLSKIKRGEAGVMTDVLKSMIANDYDSVIKVEANIMQANANRITLRNDEAAQTKLKREADSNNLLLEYYTPKTTAARKREIGVELTKMGALSVDQIERFLDPKAKEGDPYAFANIETRIAFGEITDPEELKRVAARSGMNGSQYARLNSKLLEGFDKEKSEAYRYLRRVSGVPDVASTFASKDDQHKITKDERLKNIFDTKIKEFRQLNPGVPIPYSTLSRDSEKVYNETDKADANKNRARTQLGNYVKELVTKKTVPEGFSIDENTNVDDLIRRGIIPKNDKNDTAGFVQKQINILREAQR